MRVRVQAPDIAKANRGFEDDLAGIQTRVMREASQLLKTDLFEMTVAGGLGNRVGKTWRARSYPLVGDSLEPAGWVWTKAPVLIDAFDRGVTIRAKGGAWLAIPTAAAGKRAPSRGDGAAAFGSRGGQNRARVTPGGFERRTGLKLRFVYQGTKPSLLVVDAAKRDALGRAARYQPKGRGSKLYGPAGQTIVVFILLRQVRLKKRLDIDSAAARAEARWEPLLNKHWR